MTSEKENIFLEKIDCNFPYHDRQESIELINEAMALSTNALFSVIEELCRIPVSEKESVSISVLLDLLALASTKLYHSLKEIIIDTAYKMINGQELTVDEVISKMQIIKDYPGQFAALNILYFSCNDIEGRLEPIWEDIINDWNK